MKDLALCVCAAVLLILSFPTFNLEFLAWFGFVPLFFALRGKSWRRAFALAYFTGVIFWSGIIYWLVHVTLLGTILLILYVSLYFGFFGVFSSFILRHSPLPLRPWSIDQLFIIPALWVVLEYLRSHLLTGFPWALLGYSQYLNLPVIQIADISGPWGVSFFVMMVNIALFWVCEGESTMQAKRTVVLSTVVSIAAVLGYGHHALRPTGFDKAKESLRVSVIQANIPQELKWDPAARQDIMTTYEFISNAASADNPELIIWPEAALPTIVEEEPFYYQQVLDRVRTRKIPLLLGAVTIEGDRYYNSALLLSAQGELLKKYNKIHLVPFGEYIPLKKVFPFLQSIVPIGDISRGSDTTVFSISKQAFSVLICFEDLFPEISRVFIRQGAGFLVNITNDAWYKRTSAASQHLQASVFRAVENRVMLLRSANTGISAFISPQGEIISYVHERSGNNIFVQGHQTSLIASKGHALTLYTRYGDFFVGMCVVLAGYGIIARFKKKKSAA